MSKNDKLIPWYFVAFFMVIVTVDSSFAYLAVHTHTGLITKNYYQKGLKYNDIISTSEKQQKLGWKSEIVFNQNNQLLNFKVLDSENNLIKGAKVKAYIKRMVRIGNDFSVDLQEKEKGIYSNNLNLPLKGNWNVIIVADYGGNLYKKSQKIFLE